MIHFVRKEERPRWVVCAAIKFGDLVFIGTRHYSETMLFNMRGYDPIELRSEFGEVQGFIDQNGVFMDRKEAAIVATESGQLDHYGEVKPEILFSEDLY